MYIHYVVCSLNNMRSLCTYVHYFRIFCHNIMHVIYAHDVQLHMITFVVKKTFIAFVFYNIECCTPWKTSNRKFNTHKESTDNRIPILICWMGQYNAAVKPNAGSINHIIVNCVFRLQSYNTVRPALFSLSVRRDVFTIERPRRIDR